MILSVIVPWIIITMRADCNYVTNMITGGWPALQGRDRGWRPASSVTCGNTQWVIAAINKMRKDTTHCIICYEMILFQSVSLLAGYSLDPLLPIFCIVKEILEYDHCCNVALHCSHSVTLPDLLLQILFFNETNKLFKCLQILNSWVGFKIQLFFLLTTWNDLNR